MLVTWEPSLAELTTLHLGGNAIALLQPESFEDVESLPEWLKKLGGNPYVIGKGSNLLARDGTLPLTLVSLGKFAEIEILAQTDNQVMVRVGAGVPVARLLRFCLKHGLTGLEGMAGIPGSAGGACAMNAGSFGTEIGDYITQIEIMTPSGIKTVNKNALNFTYRHCAYTEPSGFTAVVSLTLTLTKAEKDGIFRRMSLNFFKKKTRQPISAWSAGCAFKNPSIAPAGILLDKAGMRGFRMDGMAFSPVHANFLINEGSGSADAALALLDEGRIKVKNMFGTELEHEVQIIP